MSIELTILCENSVDRVSPFGLIGEHGFSCHIATSSGNYLFDTGGGLTLFHNAELLGIDFNRLNGIIFSHGHFDHTGGLRQVLEKTGRIPVYAHPDIFSERYSSNGGKVRDVGIPWSREELERAGAEFVLHPEPYPITDELLLSGEIPRISRVETGDPNLQALSATGDQVTDPLRDDLSLFIRTEQGLVVLLGCAHAGLINILDQAVKLTGEDRIHMVLGGTHLKFCSEAQMTATLERLEELQVEKIGAAHCTGLNGARRLAERFGEKFFFASVGATVTA